MNSNLSSKLQSQKPGELESLIEELEVSTKGSENPIKRKTIEKYKSTSSLPESKASKKIGYKKDPKLWLFNMFQELSNINKNGYQGCTEKWNSLDPIDIEDWIDSRKIDFDQDLRIMVEFNDYGYDKYKGQINSDGKYHGLGRLCRISGQIYEGNFCDGYKNGFGREIEFHHTYTGIFDDGSKFDQTSIKYHQVDEDKWFDQTKLRAAEKMRGDLKADIMNRMDAVKNKSRQKKRQTQKVILQEDQDIPIEEEKHQNPENPENQEGEIDQEDEIGQDELILQVVDSLWDQYDDDGNGYLDMDETRTFIQEIMAQVANAQEFDEQAFQELFLEFDEDKSGTIEKPELVSFLKQLMQE